jgi:ABC-type spermidine/putrescine transport system permease subunit II
VRDKTLPRMMFDDIEQNLTPVIPAIAVLLTALSVAVLLAGAMLKRISDRRRQAPPEG